MFGRNQHNTVKQLSFILKINKFNYFLKTTQVIHRFEIM